MKAIIKREIKAYFTSVLGWIFLAAFLFVFDLYFWVYDVNIGYPYISYALSASVFIFLIIIPILSMRSMAEDRKNKTDQMLYTAPVSVPKVIIGKYLAMVIIFSIGMAWTCICPLIMHCFGSVPFGESYTAILGIWLFGLLCLAIGLFLSSVTESQVIAAVLSFAVLFLGYMMNSIINAVAASENIFTKILGCLAISNPLDDFTSGVLSVTGIIYYVTGAALFLFFACQMVQKFRWSSGAKKLRRGVFNGGVIVVVAAVVVVVNVLAAQLPEGAKSIDVTNQKLYTLTQDTYDFLDTLDQDVTIYVLSTENDTDDVISKMLRRYEDASDHISVEYIDTAVSPTFYTTYTDEEPTSGSLIVAGESYSQVIDYYDIYEYSYDYYSYTSSIDAFDGEGQVTSAISFVTSGDLQTVYVISGHGETSLGDSFIQALEKMNLNEEDLTLLTVDEIPDDAAAIIINGPATDFSADDAAKLSAYLAGGGKALITSSVEVEDGLPNLDAVLADYGIEIEYGMVMEGDMSHCYQYPFFLLPDVDYSTETSDVDGYVMMPYSQAIVNTAEDSEALSWTAFMGSSDSAYLKTNISSITTYDKEDGDMDGAFDLAVKVADSDSGAEITVVGSVLTFTDTIDEYVSGNNLGFFKGIIRNYSGSETNISIDAKSYTYSYLSVNQAFIYVSMGLLIVALPVALIIIGVLIWGRRRKA